MNRISVIGTSESGKTTFDLDGASRVLFKTRNSRFWRETNEFQKER